MFITFSGGGQLLPGVVAKVVKPDGSLANYDEPGELVTWSPSNALRYQNDAQASKDTFIDGWVRTGDEAKVDKNAELWILDRMKEIMKVRGFQVAPAELEGCILDHPDVSDACVVGIPDGYSGEVPLAFVVLTEEARSTVLERGPQIKDSIIKVYFVPFLFCGCLRFNTLIESMSPQIRSTTNISRVELNSFRRYQRILAESCSDVCCVSMPGR